jgi:hypothetical protein
MVGMNVLKDVEPDRLLEISGAEIHHVASAVRGYVVKHALRGCAVRIDKRRSPAGIHVLQKKIFHQPRFASPRTADDIQMPAPIFVGDGYGGVVHQVSAKIYRLNFVIHRSKTSPSSTREA